MTNEFIDVVSLRTSQAFCTLLTGAAVPSYYMYDFLCTSLNAGAPRLSLACSTLCSPFVLHVRVLCWEQQRQPGL